MQSNDVNTDRSALVTGFRGIPHGDLVDEFRAAGWEGDLAALLAESPLTLPEDPAGTTEWRPLFRDYLRDLPEDLRTKYGIRPGSDG